MKTSKYLCWGLAALAFTACSNDDEVINNGPVAAQVCAGIEGIQTRAVDTTWDPDDKIGISGKSGSKQYTNVCYYTKDGNGDFAVENKGEEIYYQDDNEVTFTAYYPYVETLTDGIIEKEIKDTDQEADAQKNIDYMFASGAKASREFPQVNFVDDRTTDARFKHRMARLVFIFKQGADTDLKDMSEFTVKGLKMRGTFNTTNGKATATDGAATDLIIGGTPTASDTHTRSLILFPQEVGQDGKFQLSLKLKGVTYTAELSVPNGNTAFESGNKYTYTITVNKTEIVVNGASIDGWGNGGSQNGEATM